VSSLHVDAIRVIEACYAPVMTDEAWLVGIAESLSSIHQDCGVRALSLAIRGGFAVALAGADRGPVPTPWTDVVARWRGASPGLLSAWLSPAPPVDLGSRRLARLPTAERTEALALLRGSGVREVLGIVALDPIGLGVVISIPSLHPVRLPARTIHVLGLAAAHIASANRLRARAAGSRSAPPVEAVLEPSGRVTHAEGEAREGEVRERLALAVRDTERARGRMRRTSPLEAAELWKALVDGRWSLIDQVDADGRRFIVAHRNDPGLENPLALTQQERDIVGWIALGHSNKFVAYQLGLGTSTVAGHLRRALAKLGLRSRREVIALLGSLVRGPSSG
jgi:DNA-binding CsgD family transcriptional regulator